MSKSSVRTTQTIQVITMNASRKHTLRAWAGLVLLAGMLSAGCTDEETVFVERPFFDDPPANALGFLGYDEGVEKLTVCGNCHVGQQSEWELTQHTEAWFSLQDSGHAQEFCEGCHSVGPRGNPTDDGGWESTADERYTDVQCESCHGPGETHARNPDADGKPMAEAAVDLDMGRGCGDCHEGTHHPFVEEWLASPHSSLVSSSTAMTRESCRGCHVGQATLVKWGENADYVEKDGANLPQVCVVCHDPHDSIYEGQLRFPVDTDAIELHLCTQCHNRRTVPDPNSSHGLHPHSPEAALLVGDAGWFPPNANIDQGQIRGSHGSTGNPTLCTSCHLPMFQVTDPGTGDFVFQSTGHLFRPIPCVDAQGIPEGFETGCALNTTERTFAACTGSGCHADETAASSALTASSGTIQFLADQLHGQLIDARNPTFTVAEGALFNHSLAEFGGEHFGTLSVVGSTAHNPFLVEALLIASIQAVQAEYGVSPNVVRDWDLELENVLNRVPR
jgi:predicted CXXCH cytochrome family protein